MFSPAFNPSTKSLQNLFISPQKSPQYLSFQHKLQVTNLRYLILHKIFPKTLPFTTLDAFPQKSKDYPHLIFIAAANCANGIRFIHFTPASSNECISGKCDQAAIQCCLSQEAFRIILSCPSDTVGHSNRAEKELTV